MTDRTCSIEDCDRKHNARGLCITHYSRWRLTGSARPDDPVQPRGLHTSCVADGCDRTDLAAFGLCVKHWNRQRKSGTLDDPPPKATGANDPGWKGDNVVYRSLHTRLTRERGHAASHQCVDCGDQANDWSYDNADPDEKVSPEGMAYSTDLSRYAPRCRRCHLTFDEVPAKGWRKRKRAS